MLLRRSVRHGQTKATSQKRLHARPSVGDAATTQQSAAGDAGEDWLEVRGHVGREFAFVGVALLFGGFEAGHGYVSLVIG